MNFLITGGSGFLGQHLLTFMRNQNLNVVATVRNEDRKNYYTGNLLNFEKWNDLFTGVDVVIHTAAKAHDMSKDPNLKNIYTEVNLNLTKRIAEKAKNHGVKRFVFLSTIKVNGEKTALGSPFTADDVVNPTDDYGKSKWYAEQELLKLHEPKVFEVVIIRPCLIYGSGVKANFKNLISLVKKGIPLPFGLIKNKRSLVSVENLTDFILVCATHPKAAGEIFLVSDDRDLSLPELITIISKSVGKKDPLFPLPPSLFRLGLTLVGKKDLALRLMDSLQVDITKAKKLLNWHPSYTIEQTLLKMQQRQSDELSK